MLPLIILLLIILLASFLRLYKISDYMTFLGDEGRDVLVAKQILEGDLVFLGPRASAGDFFLGPVYYYMMAPFLFLTNYDPVGPAIMVALIGIATVYLIYYVGKDFFGFKAGIIAASLYAVSPLVIAYSRSSWNPNPMPFFTLLILYLLYKVTMKTSVKLLFFIGILFGITMQLHYLATFLGVIIAAYLFIANMLLVNNNKITIQKRITKLIKEYSMIFGGFLLGMSPFLAFEIKNGFPNIKTIISFIFSGSADPENNIDSSPLAIIGDVFLRVFGRLLTRFPSPEAFQLYDDLILLLWRTMIVSLAVIVIIALLKTKNKAQVFLLSLWLAIGIGLFGFYKKPIHDYYFGFLFPVPFLLVGNFLSSLWDSRALKKTGVVISLIIFMFLFIFNLYGMPFRSEPNRQKDQVRNIAEFVLSKTDGKPYNFALLTPGNSDHAYRYYLEINNHPPQEIENLEKDPERKTVTEQLLIVCEDITCNPLGHPQFEVAGFGAAEIEGEWNVSVVKVYKLRHIDEK